MNNLESSCVFALWSKLASTAPELAGQILGLGIYNTSGNSSGVLMAELLQQLLDGAAMCVPCYLRALL